MPWHALAFESPLPRTLMAKHGIMGIPSLVMYDDDGEMITKDAVSRVRQGDEFPWAKGPGPVFKLKDIAPMLFILITVGLVLIYRLATDWLKEHGYMQVEEATVIVE